MDRDVPDRHVRADRIREKCPEHKNPMPPKFLDHARSKNARMGLIRDKYAVIGIRRENWRALANRRGGTCQDKPIQSQRDVRCTELDARVGCLEAGHILHQLAVIKNRFRNSDGSPDVLRLRNTGAHEQNQ